MPPLFEQGADGDYRSQLVMRSKQRSRAGPRATRQQSRTVHKIRSRSRNIRTRAHCHRRSPKARRILRKAPTSPTHQSTVGQNSNKPINEPPLQQVHRLRRLRSPDSHRRRLTRNRFHNSLRRHHTHTKSKTKRPRVSGDTLCQLTATRMLLSCAKGRHVLYPRKAWPNLTGRRRCPRANT